MNETKALEVRLINLEHRVSVHAENIATIMRRIDEHGATLQDIRTVILQVKWLFIGSMIYFAAGQAGILPALAKTFGIN